MAQAIRRPICRATGLGHFSRHIEDGARGLRHLASPPVDIASSSTRRILGESAARRAISRRFAAFLNPDQAPEPMVFERPIALEPGALAKMAPAWNRPAFTSAWPDGGVLRGGEPPATPASVSSWKSRTRLAGHQAPSRGDSGKFVNVAVLEGDRSSSSTRPRRIPTARSCSRRC